MITKEQFDEAVIIIEKYKSQLIQEMLSANEVLTPESDLNALNLSNKFFWSPLNRCNFKVHGYHKRIDHDEPFKASELSKISLSELKKTRYIGLKSIDYILEICQKTGVKLKP